MCNEQSGDKIEEIRSKLSEGVELRESADDYVGAINILSSVLDDSILVEDSALIIEAANQCSIAYRLLASSYVRDGNLIKADESYDLAFLCLQNLIDKGLVDGGDPGIIRNLSHLFLYRGDFAVAEAQLIKSSQLQTNPAAVGDELCHLAVSQIALGKLDLAEENLFKGVKLIEDNNGSPIWWSYSQMALASLHLTRSNKDQSEEVLSQALFFVGSKNLKVREQEIRFMQKNSCGVVGATTGELARVRSIENKIWEENYHPEQVSENPYLLMFGGFQGSGKSTLIRAHSKENPMFKISGDRIRFLLFEQMDYQDGYMFNQIVSTTSSALLKRCLQKQLITAVDSNVDANKLFALKKLVQDRFPIFRTFAIYLKADISTLHKSLGSRSAQQGYYTGSTSNLDHSYQTKIGGMDESAYDLVLNRDDPELTVEKSLILLQELIDNKNQNH